MLIGGCGATTQTLRRRAFTPTPPLNSDQLLGGLRAVTIAHEGAQYVLRATRNGKLILTK